MRASALIKQLQKVTMNIFTNKADAYKFAEKRILRHYDIKGLEARGVESAVVRPTEWHGEGGLGGDNNTGHLTVDFKDKDGNHISTHHVYQADSHYPAA